MDFYMCYVKNQHFQAISVCLILHIIVEFCCKIQTNCCMFVSFRSVLTGLKVDPAALIKSEKSGRVKGLIITIKGNQSIESVCINCFAAQLVVHDMI